MIRRATWLLIVILCVVVSAAQDKSEVKDPAARWEKTIQNFEDWDRKNSFPSDAILFVGSSSIRMWPTRECFEGLEVINRGFGGSQISDVNYYANRIVLPYEPKVIVFYAGDNDIAAGKNAEQVFGDYRKFARLVRRRLPDTRIIFISIKPSGSRWSLWPIMKRANAMIDAFSEKDARLFYFDGATPLLDGQGKPDLELFRGDQLHLNPKGYEIWTRLLRPIIHEASKLRGGHR
ncbi:MAG: SGNH/GDSL hydrolase family protein [Sedimentisphaerales bacterium]|jgi:lysophospholipase L1-like esterase